MVRVLFDPFRVGAWRARIPRVFASLHPGLPLFNPFGVLMDYEFFGLFEIICMFEVSYGCDINC